VYGQAGQAGNPTVTLATARVVHSTPGVTTATTWFILIGLLFVGIGLSTSFIRRLPLTTALIYLVIGFLLGNEVLGLIDLHPLKDARFLEHLTEIAVIISLFTAGLKLRTRLSDPRWRPARRLAFLSMTVTVGLITLVGTLLLGFSLGAAVLLGAILSPTDPVLASDVQVRDPKDQDQLRFSLTGEAGMNDGTAFPFVMLGLGLLNLHDIGEFGWKWFAIDFVWAIAGGVGIGFLLGTLIARFVFRVRGEGKETFVLDDFLAIGLIGLSYGVAIALHAYGFLAVFAAGLALRRVERLHSEKHPQAEKKAESQAANEQASSKTADLAAPVSTVRAVLTFNEQLERIAETGAVVVLGALLSTSLIPWKDLWFIPVLFLGIRPLAVLIGLVGSGVSRSEKRYMSWFGIRGIGSLYYLMYAIGKGVPDESATRLVAITLTTMTVSIFLHGISVTPLMQLYSKRAEGKRPKSRKPVVV
jgi:NhaP-type Na+/H+ or K+/H+ antiporter